nr:ribonuclease III [Desulfobacterales bacterium]
MSYKDIDISSLEKGLGYYFKDRGLLREALQHRSYVNELPYADLKDNERLEFMGDAVLDVVISHILMNLFPNMCEGDLTRMRANLVNEKQLAEIAQSIDLGKYIFLGKGESQAEGHKKKSILANTLEAVIAAVYLDSGFESVFRFIERLFSHRLANLQHRMPENDFKSRLQEHVQSRFKIVPKYTIVREIGPDHDKTFEVELKIGKVINTRGIGKSKKDAEQVAARHALEALQTKKDTG